MTYSNLTSIIKKSPTTYGERTGKLDRITVHCVVGQATAKSVLELFARPGRKASSNYVIGKDGEIGCSVPEDIAACTSHSSINDKRAITIECASDNKYPYTFNAKVFETLVNLTVDIMKRYNKKELVWINDKAKALEFNTGDDKMLITLHRWFDNVECPGAWMIDHMDEYVKKVNSLLKNPEITSNILYKVQVGAFSKKENAEKLRDKLKTEGYKDCFITVTRI